MMNRHRPKEVFPVRTRVFSTVGLLVWLAAPGLAQKAPLPSRALTLKPEARVIPQATAPMKILSYFAFYTEGSAGRDEGLAHTVTVLNNAKTQVVAVELVLVEFDVWNQYLSEVLAFSRTAIDPGKTAEASWLHNPYGGFAFQTSVAYVSRVRFADGTIWTVDPKTILPALLDIQHDFDASQLTKKDSPPSRAVKGSPVAESR
jgi:hypothetical protein